jgi:hypothetical protein
MCNNKNVNLGSKRDMGSFISKIKHWHQTKANKMLK